MHKEFEMNPPRHRLTPGQDRAKRALDLTLASAGLVATAPISAVAWVLARASTGESGIFAQQRIGRYGQPFTVYKVRTMTTVADSDHVTVAGDARITRVGALLRMLKFDEFPQLYNVIRGDMSLVGPRPDVPGWADQLQGDDRDILTLRPGITGPASLAYRHEESLLAQADDPERFNREVIWPDKVRLNRLYIQEWSLMGDVRYILRTMLSIFLRKRTP